MGEALSSPQHTYGMLNNADILFGEVTTNDGEKVTLTRGMYAKLIEDENREKRKEAYKAYYKPYVQLKILSLLLYLQLLKIMLLFLS